jgi:RNA polymerase sigma-70 factor, ECF subfamily
MAARAPETTSYLPAVEAIVIEAARQRDEEAWRSLFAEHYPVLHRFTCSKIADKQAAEEIAAQVFEEALRGIHRYEERGVGIRAWLFRIARNLVADYLQRTSPAYQLELIEKVDEHDDFEETRSAADVRSALATLAADERRTITLTVLQERSVDECATILGRPTREVRRLQHAGLDRLRTIFTDDKLSA